MENKRSQSYDEWFPESIDYPDKTMYELMADAANRYKRNTALSFMGTRITYNDLLCYVDKAASSLKAMGASSGDVAAVCLPNTPHAVIAFYALNKIGAIANMIHPLTPPEELGKILSSTKSRFLFILDAFLPKYTEAISHTSAERTIVCSITDYLSLAMSVGFYVTKGRKIKRLPPDACRIPWSDFISSPRSADTCSRPCDSAVYLHSGGTMGVPKTIVLSSMNMNALALQGMHIVGMKDASTMSMAAILPLFHGFGLCIGMHTMMINGANSILVPIFSPENLASLLIREKPNFIAAVPTLLEGIMKNKKLAGKDLSYIKAVFCGGDTLTADLKKRFDEFLVTHNCSVKVREGYGLTETVTVCAVNPVGDNRAGTVGLPLADIIVKIVEPGTEQALPADSAGEICVSGPTVMIGYLNDPDGTDQAVKVHSDGRRWVHTGDFGSLDKDGYIHFIQRMKRIIKVSGIPVFPSQIEEIISGVPGVREVCAIGIPHPYKMQVVKVFIVSEDIADKEGLREKILETCKAKMIKHAVPSEIEFRESLPRTRVGKIDSKKLENESKK
ncbi:MAG: class I adenylate-forming enzyme family protein [Eubacteriales bacterium]|nr:class I adenylate-forming enzyme family protein [Eubacteriales bacterium]